MRDSKFLTDSKNLNIAIILILIIILISLVGALIYAILGTFMPYHIAFTGKTESNVSAYNTELMILIGIFIRLMGIYSVALSISNLFVLFCGFRKKEKWAWIYFLVIGVFISGSLLIITFPVLAFGILYLTYIVVLIFEILALAISYKEFF